MKGPSRPLSKTQEWLCWICGGLLLCSSIAGLYFHGPKAWKQIQTLRAKPAGNTASRVNTSMINPLLRNCGPAAGELIGLWVGFVIVSLPGKKRRKAGGPPETAAQLVPEPRPVRMLPSGSKKTQWQVCNILNAETDYRQIWQFDASNRKFLLGKEQSSIPGEPLATGLVAKDWRTLWQSKLNVVWLPPEHVFFRVAQFPMSSPEETRAMVELQLEKLSPIPVTQALWTVHTLPASAGSHAEPGTSQIKVENLQTLIVVIVSRSVVEEFLGKLEGQGYMSDRLELSFLDQLEATPVTEDGAWIYPETKEGADTALVAWWYGGNLRNLDLLVLPPGGDLAASLRDQLTQMAWAGELEGWLASPPRWHLVADATLAAKWEAPLREGLEAPVEAISPLPMPDLAARTARRAVQEGSSPGLLPVEFSARYRQQFVDRLWLQGLGTTLAAYLVGLAIYFVAVLFMSYKTSAVEGQVALNANSYTNALQLKAKYAVLSDRKELKFAALDSWEAVAETLPESVTLDSLNFSDKKLTLNGTAVHVNDVLDFYDKVRNAEIRGQPLFDPNGGEPPHPRLAMGGAVQWDFVLLLRRSEPE